MKPKANSQFRSITNTSSMWCMVTFAVLFPAIIVLGECWISIEGSRCTENQNQQASCPPGGGACQAFHYVPEFATQCCTPGSSECGQTACTDNTTNPLVKRVRNGWCVNGVCNFGDWEPDVTIGTCNKALLSGAECGCPG